MARKSTAGVGVILISLHKHVISKGYSLTKLYMFVISLKMVLQLGMKHLEVHSDLKLIVNQITEEYEVKHKALIPYYQAAIELAN